MAEQEGAQARRVAVEVLSDLVREVDLLPGRNEAVKVTLAGARGIPHEGHSIRGVLQYKHIRNMHVSHH